MSLSLPRRRLLQSATSLLPPSYLLPILQPCPHHRHQRRAVSLPSLNPFKRKKPSHLDAAALAAIREKEAAKKAENTESPQTGDLAPNSIFEEEVEEKEGDGTSKDPPLPSRPRDPHAMAAALDPTPHARKRWQRKMVIRSIRGRGRLSRTALIARTERQHLSKSPLIKTSVKKLFPLARQIAGKPLGEAMVQMRFSKKKAAGEVLRHLEVARDQAVVVRGMGLGGVGKEEEGKEVLVVDKKGKRRVVGDESQIYVDEAWVGRGKYESGSDHRARGQIHRLRLPYTSISVVLKEEKTRIRQMQERETKREKKRVWVPLPDRPITAQRQYPLW